MPFNVVRVKTVESTNEYLAQLMKTKPEDGLVVVAEEQTEGRGTHDRRWHSPKGGLYLSILLKSSTNKEAVFAGFVGGVAVLQTLGTLLPKAIEMTVKWPNDVLINRKKVAGILSQAIDSWVVLGVGINVNLNATEIKKIPVDAFEPTSVALESEGEHSIDAILKVFLIKLEILWKLQKTDGFEAIQYLWHQGCQMIGKGVEIVDGVAMGGKSVSSPLFGILEGIDAQGALMVTNDTAKFHFVSGRVAKCFW